MFSARVLGFSKAPKIMSLKIDLLIARLKKSLGHTVTQQVSTSNSLRSSKSKSIVTRLLNAHSNASIPANTST